MPSGAAEPRCPSLPPDVPFQPRQLLTHAPEILGKTPLEIPPSPGVYFDPDPRHLLPRPLDLAAGSFDLGTGPIHLDPHPSIHVHHDHP